MTFSMYDERVNFSPTSAKLASAVVTLSGFDSVGVDSRHEIAIASSQRMNPRVSPASAPSMIGVQSSDSTRPMGLILIAGSVADEA